MGRTAGWYVTSYLPAFENRVLDVFAAGCGRAVMQAATPASPDRALAKGDGSTVLLPLPLDVLGAVVRAVGHDERGYGAGAVRVD